MAEHRGEETGRRGSKRAHLLRNKGVMIGLKIGSSEEQEIKWDRKLSKGDGNLKKKDQLKKEC